MGLRQALGLDAYRRTLCLLPTHFGHGLICNSLFPWLFGQHLFILPAFKPEVIVGLGALLDVSAWPSCSTARTRQRCAGSTTGWRSTWRRARCRDGGTSSSALRRDLRAVEFPGEAANPITVDPVYDAMEARAILNAARADYLAAFGRKRE